MNTDISFAAEGSLEQIKTGFQKTRQFIQESEQRFTRFSEESELSQINRAAGDWFRTSPDMLTVLLLARQYCEQTQGLFDPSILADLKRIGYDKSMDLIRAQTSSPQPTFLPRQHIPFDEIILQPEESLIYLPVGMSLDLGGIAKGWIAEQAAIILNEFIPVCGVNAGGDMYLIGLPDTMNSWPVALEDPRRAGEALTILNIPPGAVATSSITRRTWKQAQTLRHHLIDPRSGEPAETEWLSVTVIADHTDLCEVYAKALLIAGPQNAPQIAKNANIAYLAVDRQGQLVGTTQSLEYLYA